VKRCAMNGVDFLAPFSACGRPSPRSSRSRSASAAASKAAEPLRVFAARVDSWSREHNVFGNAQYTPQVTNPAPSLRRYQARSTKTSNADAAKPKTASVGSSSRRRPSLRRRHGGQSVHPVVFGNRLRPGQCDAPHRATRHAVCRGNHASQVPRFAPSSGRSVRLQAANAGGSIEAAQTPTPRRFCDSACQTRVCKAAD
jgi:hypothetical protein